MAKHRNIFYGLIAIVVVFVVLLSLATSGQLLVKDQEQTVVVVVKDRGSTPPAQDHHASDSTPAPPPPPPPADAVVGQEKDLNPATDAVPKKLGVHPQIPSLQLAYQGTECRPPCRLLDTSTASSRRCNGEGKAQSSNKEYLKAFLREQVEQKHPQRAIDYTNRTGTNGTDKLANLECMFMHNWGSDCLMFEEATLTLPTTNEAPAGDSSDDASEHNIPSTFLIGLKTVLPALTDAWKRVSRHCISPMDQQVDNNNTAAVKMANGGHFFEFNTATDEENNKADACKASSLNRTLKDLRAQEAETAPANYLTRLEWLAALARKKIIHGTPMRILLTGDSMARQLSHRLLLFIGGATVFHSIPSLGAHYKSSRFVVYANGSVSTRASERKRPRLDDESDALFVLDFGYVEKADPPTYPAGTGVMDVHFHILTYHVEVLNATNTYDNFFNAIRRRLSSPRISHAPKTIFLTSPLVGNPGAGRETPSWRRIIDFQEKRNVEVLQLTRNISSEFPNRVFLFDSAGVGRLLEPKLAIRGKDAAVRCDGAHFSCSMRPMFPNVQVNFLSDCPHMKECRDDYNAYLTQLVGHVAMDDQFQ